MGMKKTMMILAIGGLILLVASIHVLGFAPQPEPPKLKERLYDHPGVVQNEDMIFMNLFPHKFEIPGLPYDVIFAPFGRTFVRWQDYDPQPEPPGLEKKIL